MNFSSEFPSVLNSVWFSWFVLGWYFLCVLVWSFLFVWLLFCYLLYNMFSSQLLAYELEWCKRRRKGMKVKS